MAKKLNGVYSPTNSIKGFIPQKKAEKKFKLTEAEANSLMWTMVLKEDETNFTSEFRETVFNVIRKIREA